jgi:putative membrane-bound dehydrogenase-like protein
MSIRFFMLPLLLGATAALAWPAGNDKGPITDVPRIKPRKPAEAVKAFVAHPGFQVDLVAAEPLLMCPVALDIDEDGRMFVAEFPEYNAFANKKPQGRGRIVVLEDTKGNGRYDRRTVYADNVDFAVAVACWDGGVYVGAPPDLLYLKDTKGDGKADVRRVVYTGFGKDQASEGMINSFRWGLDNRFHISTSIDGGDVRPGNKPDARPVSVRNQGFLLDPRGETFELTGGGGQFGMSLDDWGRTFICDNSNPYGLVMYDSRYLARNPHLEAPAPGVSIAPTGKNIELHRVSKPEPWRVIKYRLRNFPTGPDYFTGGSGITVYRGDAYPAEFRGNLFVGDVAYNLVHRARVQASGVGLTAIPVNKDAEFLASYDNWFRPVQFVNAPDGCLWVIDMYHELIEGAAFVPPEILKFLDVASGNDRGRVYRIAPAGFKGRPQPRLGKSTTEDLVALLEHPNAWHRETASRLLYQRQDRKAVGPLEKLAETSPVPLARAHALYALAGLHALRPGLVLHGLEDPEPRVREHALRLSEHFRADKTIRRRLGELTGVGDPLVRYQLAFSLGAFPNPAPSLARLARRDGADPWITLAILSSADRCSGELFCLLAADADFRKADPGRKFLSTLAEIIGAANRPADCSKVVQQLADLVESDRVLAGQLVLRLVSKQPGLAGKLTGEAGRKVGAILAGQIATAKEAAADEKKPVVDRVAAVRVLASATLGDVGLLLANLLDSRQPPEVQVAAIDTLGRHADPGVAVTLLGAWKGFSPSVRATATEALFARSVWINAFLDAVEKNQVARADVDPARLGLLKAYPDPQVKARVAKIFAGARPGRRNEVVAAYAGALKINGDAARGKLVFKMHCSACHQLEGVGQAVGADLKAIRSRGMEAVLLNILDPNREVLPKYLVYVLETTTGRALTGMIVTETATSLTLRRADGVEVSVPRSQIAELRGTGQSYMPEGLEKQIDVAAMADLLSYLNSVK